ncbi:hypothetical protein BRC89_02310 [Halobacteriales archaeon QS_4_70_19]|nr:MAG: hypothetical protein BRC89_02310 [Halobacteriales archaeon QS_4_70_19]
MVVRVSRFTDPHTPVEDRYECYECSAGVVAGEFPGPCPDCGSRVRNIAVPWE